MDRDDIRKEWITGGTDVTYFRESPFREVQAVWAHETGTGWDPLVLLPYTFWPKRRGET